MRPDTATPPDKGGAPGSNRADVHHIAAVPLAVRVRGAALAADREAIAPLPVSADGQKRPALAEWATYQSRRPTLAEIGDWFAARAHQEGVGLVCGAVSGGLELFEFDDSPTIERFCEAALEAGLGDVVARLDAGYCERTPGGGLHWLFRTERALANTPLARRPCPDPATCSKAVHVLIETRGEGGFVVIAPSGGATHPTGREYELVSGGLETIPELTTDERDALFDLARTFDEMPVPVPREPSTRPADGTRPGDEWAAVTGWPEIMERAGFKLDSRRGDEDFWTRPGKREGVSATTNYKGSDLLYVFSSSIGDLEPEESYTKFGAYAALEHRGDFADAARALAAQGYGAPSAGPTSTAPPIDATDGTRARTGGAFVLDAPVRVPSLLGDGDAVLHAQGEALLLVGPDGVGKSTLAQQYVLAAIGIGDGTLLGLDVTPVTGQIVYLAMDRPQQIARSLRRMVSEADRAILDERLVAWTGPLPVDVLADPRALLPWIRTLGDNVERVVVDSLKDVILGLSEDKSGAAWNMARQVMLAAGVEMVEIHHQRKEQRGAGAGKPKKLADVYGSRWLTAGAGSVVLLWGEPGDPVVELVHLKQPAVEVGPFRVLHDQASGRMTVFDRVDLYLVVKAAPRGLAVADAARAIFETDAPTTSQIEKARRQLQALVKRGVAFERPVPSTDHGGKPTSLFFGIAPEIPITPNHATPDFESKSQSRTNHAPPPAQSNHGAITQSREAAPQTQESNHATNHGNHMGEQSRLPPSLEGATRAPETGFEAQPETTPPVAKQGRVNLG